MNLFLLYKSEINMQRCFDCLHFHLCVKMESCLGHSNMTMFLLECIVVFFLCLYPDRSAAQVQCIGSACAMQYFNALHDL